MYGTKRILPFHLVTLLFTILFLLVKVNPYYYSWQNTISPRRTENNTSSSLQARPKRHDVHVVIDKSITENKQSLLPAIRFTGILFTFFVLFFSALVTRPKFLSYTTSPSLTCRLALLRVRRL